MAPGTPEPSSWAWPPATGVSGPRPAPCAVCPCRERPQPCLCLRSRFGTCGLLGGPRGAEPSADLCSCAVTTRHSGRQHQRRMGPAMREHLPPASGLSPGSALASSLLHDGPCAPCAGAWVSSQCLCAACRLPGAPRSLPAWHPALSRQPCSATGPDSPARGPCSLRLHLEGSAQLASTAADIDGTLFLRAPSPLAFGVCWETEVPFEESLRERPVA